ncbi:hypothetical protein L1987_56729 [Smallanthus sonchifolius]|uniref:Uncharacterized protein n=1 Tax=Smallanthus sonchifolius TaxID=185202 RepID=A0ACB9DBI8_9ASTR|nr:hypothetical protein L1987_56729 [Smallanthus sonchifolius]
MSEDGTSAYGLTNMSPVGDVTMMDTEMEGLKHFSSPASIQVSDNDYGMFSPRKDSTDIQSVIWDSNNGHYNLSGGIQAKVGLNTTPAVTKPRVPNVDEDGFITVTRRKKMGPIKVQGRKQKPVRIKPASQQYGHVRPMGSQAPAGQNDKQLGKAPQANQVANKHGVLKPPIVVSNATKKGSAGFNFTRAVQGDRGGKNQQHPSTKMATHPKTLDIDTTNRFSVLDIPSSIKVNKLIEVQDDMYHPDQNLEDGMELDMSRSKDVQISECQSSQDRVGDQLLSVCQPTGHKVTTAHPVIEEKEEKDYGISNAQKLAITSRLCGPANAVRAADMDNWDQGEHEFFEDQVKAMGLDYDYCIEDVESDDENGTAQFFAAQMKVGMPKGPFPASTQSP